MKILGIDYGEKNVGIAVSTDEQDFAFPHSVINNDEYLFNNIEKIIKEENIGEIVIGESLDYKGQENPIMEEIKKFVAELKERFKLPVHYEIEILTSVQARRIQGHTKAIDASAASLILNNYLEKKHDKNIN